MESTCVLFDLDGTLLDTSTGILNSVKDTISHFELPSLDENQLNVFMGCSIYDAFSRFYPYSDSSQLVTFFRKVYAEKHFEEAKEYDGIRLLLEQLHDTGVSIGVATFKRDDLAHKLLSNYSFSQYIDSISGSDSDGKLRKPDIIRNSLDSMSVRDLTRVTMVGDAENDAKAAREVRVRFIGVTYGYGFEESNNGVDFPLARSPKEIIDLIRIS